MATGRVFTSPVFTRPVARKRVRKMRPCVYIRKYFHVCGGTVYARVDTDGKIIIDDKLIVSPSVCEKCGQVPEVLFGEPPWPGLQPLWTREATKAVSVR